MSPCFDVVRWLQGGLCRHVFERMSRDSWPRPVSVLLIIFPFLYVLTAGIASGPLKPGFHPTQRTQREQRKATAYLLDANGAGGATTKTQG